MTTNTSQNKLVETLIKRQDKKRFVSKLKSFASNAAASALIAASISAGIAVAYAFQPAKVADDSHQVVITAQKYEVLNRACIETCIATVKANDYNIYVEYKLDDDSVEFLDILNVVRFDETVNAYVDRYEIEKINAAIVGGVK